jgi:protein TonB
MIVTAGTFDNKHAVKFFHVLSFLLVFIFFASPLSAQGKKRGKVTTKHANGTTESAGKVKNYKKQGLWKYWSEDGTLTKTVTYKDDSKTGLYTEYYYNGQKSVEGSYSGNLKTGPWNSWYIDGKLSAKLNYTTDLLSKTGDVYNGVQQWWYENGELREQSNYENGKLVYKNTFYSNGKKRAIENYKAGVPDGTWRKYPAPSETKDTLPSSIDNYSNGKLNGVHLGYTRGRLSEEFYYKDDLLHGSYKKWDSNSQLGISENYVNGKRDGLCKYFNYGKCIREVTYENGRINGEEKEYDGRGELFRISWYKKGIVDSTYNYHKNGKLAISRTYKYYPGFVRTEEFSEYTEWDSAGVLLLRGTYHFEMKDKDWTTYYANGKVKSLTPWSAGKIKGVYKKWYANGKLMLEMECEGNRVTTQPKVWDEKGKVIKPGTKAYNEIVDSSKPGEIYNDPKKYKENRTAEPTVQVISMEDVVRDGDARYDNEDISVDVVDAWVEIPPMIAQEEMVYTFVEVMPVFPGGNDSMKQFIKRNIRYPEIYKEASIQGNVYIAFIIEKDGSLSRIEVKKGVTGAPLLNAEAIRVVKAMPRWTPGLMNGKPVRVGMTIPIRFTLD